MKVFPAFEIPCVRTTVLESFNHMAHLSCPEFLQFLVKPPNLGQEQVYLAE